MELRNAESYISTERVLILWTCGILLFAGAVGLGILFVERGLSYLMFAPVVVIGMSGYVAICLLRTTKKTATGAQDEAAEGNDLENQTPKMPVKYTYEQLREATGDFREKLGAGGFGSVFKGTLENGQKIAVKRLEGVGQGKKEFVAEVKTIGNIHHVSLVKLTGYYAEATHRALVYEFLRNGSLDKWIFNNELGRSLIDWETRKKIIVDVAKGLAFLHEECMQKIVHLDIKPQNILLDANLRAKISDFGLSRLIDRDQSQVVTKARGTFGYMAPEIVLRGAISEKADVYSFGVVVLEMVCGRRNLDKTQSLDLLTILKEKQKADRLVDMIDCSIEDLLPNELEAIKIIKVASLCLQKNYLKRPCMSMVVRALEGSSDVDNDLGYEVEREIAQPLTSIETSTLSGPR